MFLNPLRKGGKVLGTSALSDDSTFPSIPPPLKGGETGNIDIAPSGRRRGKRESRSAGLDRLDVSRSTRRAILSTGRTEGA